MCCENTETIEVLAEQSFNSWNIWVKKKLPVSQLAKKSARLIAMQLNFSFITHHQRTIRKNTYAFRGKKHVLLNKNVKNLLNYLCLRKLEISKSAISINIVLKNGTKWYLARQASSWWRKTTCRFLKRNVRTVSIWQHCDPVCFLVTQNFMLAYT